MRFLKTFWGDGRSFLGTAQEFKRFRKEASGFHDQFCWNEAEQGTPRPGGLNLRGEVVGMEQRSTRAGVIGGGLDGRPR